MEGRIPILRPLTHLLVPIGDRFRRFVGNRVWKIAAIDLLIFFLVVSVISLILTLLGLYGINPLGALWSDPLYRRVAPLLFL